MFERMHLLPAVIVTATTAEQNVIIATQEVAFYRVFNGSGADALIASGDVDAPSVDAEYYTVMAGLDSGWIPANDGKLRIKLSLGTGTVKVYPIAPRPA